MAHPPRSKPPRRSSSGPPSPCITPSTEMLVVIVNLMSWFPSPVIGGGALVAASHLCYERRWLDPTPPPALLCQDPRRQRPAISGWPMGTAPRREVLT